MTIGITVHQLRHPHIVYVIDAGYWTTSFDITVSRIVNDIMRPVNLHVSLNTILALGLFLAETSLVFGYLALGARFHSS